MRLSMRISQMMLGAIAAFGLVLAGLFGMPAAQAHDQLTGGDPASGDAVAQAPDKMTLTFSGEIRTVSGGSSNQIIVTNRDGEEMTHGEVEVKGQKTMRDLQPLPAGTYDVQWAALSSDGHRIEGKGDYSFTVTKGASKKEIAAWEKKNGEQKEDAGSGSAGASSEAATGSEAQGSDEAGSESDSATADTPESTADTTTIMWIVGGVLVIAIVLGILLQVTRKKTRDQ